MGRRDPRVDDYIASAAAFAQPLLAQLRQAVHDGCPDADETIKWGMPFFMHGGTILAHMAAFKQHCAFGFWRGRAVAEPGRAGEAMGQFGRIASPADLPPRRELQALVEAAVQRKDGAAPPPARRAARPGLALPDDLAAALNANAAARASYDHFAPSKQRDYVEWVLEAKQAATRARRIAQAVAWLAEGKARHWKHER